LSILLRIINIKAAAAHDILRQNYCKKRTQHPANQMTPGLFYFAATIPAKRDSAACRHKKTLATTDTIDQRARDFVKAGYPPEGV